MGISGILLWPGGKTRKMSGGNAPDTVAGSALGKREEGKGGKSRGRGGDGFVFREKERGITVFGP